MRDTVLRRGIHSSRRNKNRKRCKSYTAIGRPCRLELSRLGSRLRDMKIDNFRSESS